MAKQAKCENTGAESGENEKLYEFVQGHCWCRSYVQQYLAKKSASKFL